MRLLGLVGLMWLLALGAIAAGHWLGSPVMGYISDTRPNRQAILYDYEKQIGFTLRSSPSMGRLSSNGKEFVTVEYRRAFTNDGDMVPQMRLIGHDGVSLLNTPTSLMPDSLSWSPEGRRIAYGGTDDQLRVMDLAENSTEVVFSDLPLPLHLAWSPTSEEMALLTQETLYRLDWQTGTVEPWLSLDGERFASGLAWSPDGRWLAYLLSDSEGQWLHLLDTRTDEVTATGNVTTGMTEIQWRDAQNLSIVKYNAPSVPAEGQNYNTVTRQLTAFALPENYSWGLFWVR